MLAEMRDSWLKLIGSVLRPARPHLERCLREREPHLEARQLFAQERAWAIANCVARIESARAEVFAAQDGVVTLRMTQLESEWRRLSRSDPDGGLMDLWVRIAPSSWIDRKRWRDGDPASKLETAIALAADVEGVEAAEAAIDSLRATLAPWGTPTIGTRVRWRPFDHDFEGTAELLAKPLAAAWEVLESLDRDGKTIVVRERAGHLERDVYEAALARFPDRDLLARAIGHAAFVDFVWRASLSSMSAADANPVTPLRKLWSAGYVLSAVDADGVTIELPPL